MEYRIEKDTMGEVSVPAHVYWGAQTQRSIENFKIAQDINRMPKEIIKAIKTVLTGKKYFINEVANILFEDLDAKTKNQRIYLDNPILSKREVQIIHFYAKQFTTKNIATSLNISKRTIEGHRRNIYKKTGINSIAELIAFANDIGFSE